MEDIITHGLAPEAKTGQNGGKNPSWQKVGEVQPQSTVAKSIAAANKAKVPAPDAPDWQTRPVSSAQAVKTHPGTKGPSPSGTVPQSNVRKANDGFMRAVGHGHMRK
jgi:hypothetical protein